MKKALIAVGVIAVVLVGVLSFFIGRKVGLNKTKCEIPVSEELNVSQTGKRVFIKYFSNNKSLGLLSDDREEVDKAKKVIVLSHLLEDEDFIREKNTFTLSNSYIKGTYLEMFNEEISLKSGDTFSFPANTGKSCICNVEEKETTCSYISEDFVDRGEPVYYVASNEEDEYLHIIIGTGIGEDSRCYEALFRKDNRGYYFIVIGESGYCFN